MQGIDEIYLDSCTYLLQFFFFFFFFFLSSLMVTKNTLLILDVTYIFCSGFTCIDGLKNDFVKP